jgi:hypothetical protein
MPWIFRVDEQTSLIAQLNADLRERELEIAIMDRTLFELSLLLTREQSKGCELAEWVVADLLGQQNESSTCTDDDMGSGAGEE